MPNRKRERIFARYTLLFACLMVPYLACILLAGKCLLWQSDAFRQQFTTLWYTRKLIRELVTTGKLTMFDPTVGPGLDVFGTFMYYGLSDPLQWLSALCPEGWLVRYYDVLAVMYIYLSGAAFCAFVRRAEITDDEDGWAIPLAAMAYVSCGYLFIGLIKNPYYAAGPLYLALILYAVEGVFRRGRLGALPWFVGLAVVSNFYLSFATGLLAAVYLFLRLPMLEKGKRLRAFCITVLGAALGLMLSGFVLVPSVYNFLLSGRVGGEKIGYTASLLRYPANYYALLVSLFAVPYDFAGFWSLQSFVPIILFAVILLLCAPRDRINRRIALFIVLIFIGLCVPAVGKVFNGFGYITNRWSYAYALAVCVATARMLPVLARGEYKRRGVLLIAAAAVACMAVYAVFAEGLVLSEGEVALDPSTLMQKRLAALAGAAATVFTAAVLCVLPRLKEKTRRRVLSVGVMLCCFGYTFGYGLLAFTGNDYYPADVYDRIAGETGSAVRLIEDDSFYRLDTGMDVCSHAPIHGFNGAGWYWSMLPGACADYCIDLQLSTLHWTIYMEGFGADLCLDAAAAVKYAARVGGETDALPYGFAEQTRTDDAVIYVNENARPLGVLFASELAKDDYDLLNPVEKRFALLSRAVVDEGSSEGFTPVQCESLPFTLSADENAEIGDGRVTAKKGAVLTIDYAADADSLVWLWIKGTELRKCDSLVDLTFVSQTDAGVNHGTIIVKNGNYNYDQGGVCMYLGRPNAENSQCLIKPRENCVFDYEEIQLLSVPISAFEEAARAVQPTDLTLKDNTVSGTVTCEADSTLQVSLPYSGGWKATVDGEPAEILSSGGMYMGIRLTEGTHEIRMTYETPGLKLGAILTAVGLAGMLVVGVLALRKKKN